MTYSSEDLNSSKVVVGNNGKKRTYDGSQGPSPEESDNENSSGAGGSEDAPTITQTSFANLREEQKQLHVIAKHPGEIALLPDTWADHFRAVPLPRGVFYKKTRKTSNWPRIYERSEGQDFHGGYYSINHSLPEHQSVDILNRLQGI